MLENLKKYHVKLASKSPRRRELLAQLRIPFNCVNIGGLDETYPADMPVSEIPLFLANRKADAYIDRINDRDMIITADTLVICGDRVCGKPADIESAVSMLMSLSGKIHKVVTGVCILTKTRRTSFTSQTDVKFAQLDESEVRYYVENYMPLDKAGSYGIQEWIGCVAVEKIEGSFYNVMGLPVHRLYQELKLF